MKTPDEISREEVKFLNEQIAKFLGWFQREDGVEGSWWKLYDNAYGIAYSVENNYPHQGLPFNRDWNYLMEAMTKISDTYSPVWKDNQQRYVIEPNWTQIDLGNNTIGIEGTFLCGGLDVMKNTWYAAGKFCEWYNEEITQKD